MRSKKEAEEWIKEQSAVYYVAKMKTEELRREGLQVAGPIRVYKNINKINEAEDQTNLEKERLDAAKAQLKEAAHNKRLWQSLIDKDEELLQGLRKKEEPRNSTTTAANSMMQYDKRRKTKKRHGRIKVKRNFMDTLRRKLDKVRRGEHERKESEKKEEEGEEDETETNTDEENENLTNEAS